MSLSGTGEIALVLQLSPKCDDISHFLCKSRKSIFKWHKYLLFLFLSNQRRLIFKVKSVRGIYGESMTLLRLFSQAGVPLGSLGFGFLAFQNIVRHKRLCQKALE